MSGSFFPVLKEWDKVGSMQSSPRWDSILKTGIRWILVQNPEISHGQDERSKFNTKNRKLAWIPCTLHRKVLVWKLWNEKRLEKLSAWHRQIFVGTRRVCCYPKTPFGPSGKSALKKDNLFEGNKGEVSHWYTYFPQYKYNLISSFSGFAYPAFKI